MRSKTVVLKNRAQAGTPIICASPMRPMSVMVPGRAGTPYRASVSPASRRALRVRSSGSTDSPAVVTMRSAPAPSRSRTPCEMSVASSGAKRVLITSQPCCWAFCVMIGAKRS